MFFENPWYWPVLWSSNPHITNPHWIFPGDLVYLTPPLVTMAPIEMRPSLVVSGKTRTEEKEKVFGRKVGFLSAAEYKKRGEIKNSFEEKIFLSEFDDVYVKFEDPKKVRKGDKFLIYRILGNVKHPLTGEQLGYKIEYVGITRVVSTDKPLFKAVLSESYKEIFRGDFLAPFSIPTRLVEPVSNQQNLDATIVETLSEGTWLGEYDYVIVDRGKKDGVVAGNRFIIKKKGDGVIELKEKDKKDFPYEDIGEVLVLEAYDVTSLGILTYSRTELNIGDYCVMVKGY
jgi:hypothetical protein